MRFKRPNPGPVQAPVWSEITTLVPSVTLYGMWAPRADYIIENQTNLADLEQAVARVLAAIAER